MILISTDVLGQQTDPVFIHVSEDSANDRFSNYEISIQNGSDSVICILHSIFIDLTTDVPKGLPLYSKSKEREEFILSRSFDDTTYDAEAAPRKGEFILPHQTLNFRVKILKPTNLTPKYLTMQYFYLINFCYNDLKIAMKDNVGSWYYKYARFKKSVKL